MLVSHNKLWTLLIFFYTSGSYQGQFCAPSLWDILAMLRDIFDGRYEVVMHMGHD